MKKRAVALFLSTILCFSLTPCANADDTTVNTENGYTWLEYHDPNPLPPPPGSVVEEPDNAEEEPNIAPDESASPFADVHPGDYCYDAVLWAVERGIANGNGQVNFGPDTKCTRGETMAILWRAAGSPAPRNSKSQFRDVLPGDYYHDAVLWAVELGITNGTSATTFTPSGIVTRGQIVSILYRAVGARDTGGDNPFIDVPENKYYAGPVRWAVSQGITNGTSANTFSPDQICTRGEIVTFLYRAASEG